MKLDAKTVAILLIAGYLGAALGNRFLPAQIQTIVKGA